MFTEKDSIIILQLYIIYYDIWIGTGGVLMITVAERLKTLREGMKFSQKKMAELLNVM